MSDNKQHQKYPHLAHKAVADAVKQHEPDRKKIETYLDEPGKVK